MIEFKGTDEAVAKLLQAIGKARVKFNGLLKDANGQVGHTKFKYMPLATIVAAIEGPLNDEGVSFIQPMSGDVDKATITTVFAGHGASVTSSISFARPANIQEFGKVSTYQRRYALQSFLVLEGEDADDAVVAQKQDSKFSPGFKEFVVPAKPLASEEKKSEPAPAVKSEPTAAVNSTEDLKNAIVEERKRLGWDSVRLSNEAFRMFKVHLPQTNDEQRRELLNKMKGMQPEIVPANPL